jgi:Flp pilus assembly protein protease CpaA
MSDMRDPSQPEADPPIRFLKILVTVLAGTMIAGLITIIALIVIRFPAMTATAPALPENISLPAGEVARAVTFGTGWIAVVTERDEILILDAASGALRQRIAVAP